jgi:hypothetical protein
MPATLLSVIQSHCKLHAIGVPSSVTGSTDTQIIQLWEILNDVLTEMTRESDFNVTTYRATFTVIAAADQGAMSTLAPYGYQAALLETFFDLTQRRPLYGPVSETEWEELQALPSAGVWFKFRIWQDHLWLDPVPTVPLSNMAFEYMSSWATKDTGGTPKELPTADNDTFVFPDVILKRGLAARWKQIKGLPYQADETRNSNAMLNSYVATRQG